MSDAEQPPKLTYPQFKQHVCGADGQRFVYDIELRAMWKAGMSPAEAQAKCTAERRFHRVEKIKLAGRPKQVGAERKPMLSHYTVMRRLADANAEICRKLLKHRMSESDVAMVRKIKADAEDICLRPREDVEDSLG